MPFFSIIVPVYKVEKYLNQCVSSILEQDFKDFELILVDDGSPDGCPAICDELAITDERIKVIHKINGGLSDARNAGLAIASGDYVIFLDSDDFWEGKDSLNELNKQIKISKAEAIIFGVVDFYETQNKRVISRGNFPNLKHTDSKAYTLNRLISTKNFPGSAWMFSVQRSLLVENSIYFKKGIKAEDIDWIINVLIHSKTFSVLNKIVYVYRKNRQGSITNTSDHKNIEGVLFAIDKWQSKLEACLLEERFALLHYLANQYLTIFVSYSSLRGKDRDVVKFYMKKAQSIMKYDKTLQGNVARFCMFFLGFNVFARLVHSLYHWKKSK